MHGATRSATVTCKVDVELLAVGRDDFVDIFMHVEKDKEPEHIQFLRTIQLLQDWPIEKLPWNDPKICLFTFFRSAIYLFVVFHLFCHTICWLDEIPEGAKRVCWDVSSYTGSARATRT